MMSGNRRKRSKSDGMEDPEVKALRRLVESSEEDEKLKKVLALALRGHYTRTQNEIDQGARAAVREECAARSMSEDIGRGIDDSAKLSAGRRVSLLRWDEVARDAGGEEKVREIAERAFIDAGGRVVKEAVQRIMSTNREPIARGWKPTVQLAVDKNDLRSYEEMDDYAPGGLESEEDLRCFFGSVTGVPKGVVSVSYDVDDEAIGDEWRRRFAGDDAPDEDGAHAGAVLDKVCAEVYARACMSNAEKPPTLGVDVEEVAAVGIDCYTRRACELAIEYATDGDERCEAAKTTKSDFARRCLLPCLVGRVSHGGEKKMAASLVAAAVSLGNASPLNSRERLWCAAIVSTARWLQSLQSFRARPTGTGVVVVNPQGLSAHSRVCDYLGEVYSPAKWLEKLSATIAARRIAFGDEKANATSPPEAFHNIALERPSRDPRGYALFFVDAGGTRANFASSLAHSCDGNVASSVFVRDDLSLSVALHTTRFVDQGEELSYDYSACTSSEREWREAVCLCGAPTCRGSYVELVNADELQQCLNRAHNPLDRLTQLLRASIAHHDNVSRETTLATLARHGLGDAFFHRNDSSLETTPAWLEKYVVSLLEFLEFERGQLPFVLLRDAESDDARMRARIASRARLVLEQRIQALACAVSVAVSVARLRDDHSQHEPLLQVMDHDAVLVSLRNVFERLAEAGAQIALQHKPKKKEQRLSQLSSLVVERARSLASECNESRAQARSALLEFRSALEEFAAGTFKEDDDIILNAVRACADAILLIAHTNTLVSTNASSRSAVLASPVPVRARDLGDDLAEKKDDGEILRKLRRAKSPEEVVAQPRRCYGSLAELEALLCWHDIDKLAEPTLGDGKLAQSVLFGCALLPDPAAVLSTGLSLLGQKKKVTKTTSYEKVGRRELVTLLEDPISRARPWTKKEGLCDAFSCDNRVVEFFGSPMLDASLGDFAGIDATLKELSSTSTAKKAVKNAPSCGDGASCSQVHTLAEALPDRPPSRWVACDLCQKWRRVPWTAADFDENCTFVCADQRSWGIPASEATCETPEPKWGEEDVVVGISKLDASETCVGTKCDALCTRTNVWFEAKIVDENSLLKENHQRKLRIHFAKWASKFDEWFDIPQDSYRLAPHRTYSASNGSAQRAAKGLDKKKTPGRKRSRR